MSRELPLPSEMKRYHVTTFGCQMNEHDSERMKGMLESLGYGEAASRDEADLILFNTCSIREKADNRFLSYLGQAKRLKVERPDRVVGVGGCWAQSVKEELFARFPFVDVAFGPGQVHKLAEFLTSDSLTAQGFFEFEGFTGDLPAKRTREFQAWVQISVGCNMSCPYCIVPATRGREVSRSPRDLVSEVLGVGRRGRGDVARPERELLRPRSTARSPDHVRGIAGADRRYRRHRANPLHEPTSEGHARGRDPGTRGTAVVVSAHPSPAAVGIERGA